MSGLFIALAVVAGFILGVRVGFALAHREARKRRERDRASSTTRKSTAR